MGPGAVALILGGQRPAPALRTWQTPSPLKLKTEFDLYGRALEAGRGARSQSNQKTIAV